MKDLPLLKTDETIINALQSQHRVERNHAITFLCKDARWMAFARKAVFSAGGAEADVEDVFQESLTALVRNIMNGKFNGESKISTYFFRICQLRYLKKYKKKEFAVEKADTIIETQPSIENYIIEREKNQSLKLVMDQLLSQMGEVCRRMLLFSKLGYSMQAIAQEMAYTNIQSAKNQALRCRKELREMMEADPKLLQKIQSLR